jgi:hypothetical protein
MTSSAVALLLKNPSLRKRAVLMPREFVATASDLQLTGVRGAI